MPSAHIHTHKGGSAPENSSCSSSVKRILDFCAGEGPAAAAVPEPPQPNRQRRHPGRQLPWLQLMDSVLAAPADSAQASATERSPPPG